VKDQIAITRRCVWFGKVRTELMKPRGARQARAEPSRGAESGRAESGVSRADALV